MTEDFYFWAYFIFLGRLLYFTRRLFSEDFYIESERYYCAADIYFWKIIIISGKCIIIVTIEIYRNKL